MFLVLRRKKNFFSECSESKQLKKINDQRFLDLCKMINDFWTLNILKLFSVTVHKY